MTSYPEVGSLHYKNTIKSTNVLIKKHTYNCRYSKIKPRVD